MKKKLTLLLFCLTLLRAGFSQETKRNIRFGVKFAPAISWLIPDNDKKIKNDGTSLKMALGLVTEFKFNEVASISTGIDYMTAGGKTSYLGTETGFYLYKDDEIAPATTKDGYILTPDIATIDAQHGYTVHRLEKRDYKIGYIHIPLSLKLKTKDIGGFTYFAQIGGDVFIRTKGRADDQTRKFNFYTGTTEGEIITTSNIDIAKQINPLTLAGNIGLGAEYALSGTTSAFFSLHYLHALNTTKTYSDYLLRSTYYASNKNEIGDFPNILKNRQVVLALGILF